LNKYEVLKKYYGYDSFRYPQERVIDSLLDNKNTIIVMSTGGGKSVCFQIPAILSDGITIVVTPLVSLMYDQVRELNNIGINARYLNSLLEPREQRELYDQLKEGNIKILYVSPERLSNPRFMEAIIRIKISYLIIDEAHTIMWHMDFRESFLDIKSFIDIFPYKITVGCFTATANKYTIDEIKRVLDINNFNIISSPFDRKELFYIFKYNVNKLDYIDNYLSSHNSSGIIYCQTRKEVMGIYELFKDKYSITFFHGGLDNDTKIKNQNDFISGNIRIIVCTVSFGMGINKPDIRFVINYNIPDSIESLAQMSGRCSRDKKYGECIVLYNDIDNRCLEYFINSIDCTNKNIKETKRVKSYKYFQLNSIIKLAKSNICIHKGMALYFGQRIKDCTNMCSRCLK